MKRDALMLNVSDAPAQPNDGLFLFASRILGDRGHMPDLSRSHTISHPLDVTHLDLRKRT